MKICEAQTNYLLSMIASTKPDGLGCDECFNHMAEFVERELAGVDLSDAMQRVARHLSQCECCDYEHDALVEALGALQSQANAGR